MDARALTGVRVGTGGALGRRCVGVRVLLRGGGGGGVLQHVRRREPGLQQERVAHGHRQGAPLPLERKFARCRLAYLFFAAPHTRHAQPPTTAHTTYDSNLIH